MGLVTGLAAGIVAVFTASVTAVFASSLSAALVVSLAVGSAVNITADLTVGTTVVRPSADGNPATFGGIPRHATECRGIPRALPRALPRKSITMCIRANVFSFAVRTVGEETGDGFHEEYC